MKIHVMSDLHLEHLNASNRARFFLRLQQMLQAEPVDTVVLAGDIGSIYHKKDLLNLLRKFQGLYQHIIYVPGNHEFFGCVIADGDELRLDVARLNCENKESGIYYLTNNRCTVEGKVFAGGTGWYPDCGEWFLKQHWIDYRLIKDCHPEAHVQNAIFRERILESETPADVVVSHMLPTVESIGERWRASANNVFYLGGFNLSSYESKAKLPKLWIHGHTHDPKNFVSALGFRVYCNPKGYPRENANPNFWEQLVVEI